MAAERTKRNLSAQSKVSVHVENVGGGGDLSVPLTRASFEVSVGLTVRRMICFTGRVHLPACLLRRRSGNYRRRYRHFTCR